jgi:hypothetical protein
MSGYWTRALEKRVSRRQALAMTGMTAAAATFLVSGALPLDSQPGTDAESIASIRRDIDNGRERVVIDFVRSDGAQAERAGRASAEILHEHGIVRVYLDDAVTTVGKTPEEIVRFTAPKYARLGGELADQAFIIRSDNGTSSLYVDIHLAAPAEARLLALGSPARLVVDLQPGGPPAGTTMQRLSGTQDPSGVVVLTPKQGETATYPLRLSGYSRTFEAHIVAEVRQGGAKVAATSGLTSDWLKTWGTFNLTIDSGPKGPVEIFVGDYSPANGEEQGVYIPLTMQ